MVFQVRTLLQVLCTLKNPVLLVINLEEVGGALHKQDTQQHFGVYWSMETSIVVRLSQ
jgi:hypothetical protein